MSGMRNWMLGAAVVVGGLGLASAPAQAAEFGAYGRGPAAQVRLGAEPGCAGVGGYGAYGHVAPARREFRDLRNRDRFERYPRHFDRDRGHYRNRW